MSPYSTPPEPPSIPPVVLPPSPSRPPRGLVAVVIALTVALVSSLGYIGFLLQSRATVTVTTVANGVTSGSTSAPGGSTAVVISSNYLGGTVTVNGQPKGAPPQIMQLGSGMQTIAYAAPPFAMQSCTITLPLSDQNFGDTCSYAAGAVNGGAATLQIIFDFGLSAVPSNQLAQVEGLATQQLTTLAPSHTVPVPVGALYVTGLDTGGQPEPQKAIQPLSATASAVLPPGSQQHITLGSSPFDQTNAARFPAHTWALDLGMALRWQCRTATGQSVSDVAFTNEIDSTSVFVRIGLHYTGNGWEASSVVIPQPPSLATMQGDNVAQLNQDVAQAVLQHDLMQASSSNLTFDTTTQSVAISFQVNNAGPTYRVIWRYGVLLAADDATLKLLPLLPLAPAVERTA